MNTQRCPKCGKIGLQVRYSKATGAPYYANVETYPSGAAYFRSLHTREECDAYAQSITDAANAQVALVEAMEQWRTEGQALAARARTEGYEAVKDALEDHMARMPR